MDGGIMAAGAGLATADSFPFALNFGFLQLVAVESLEFVARREFLATFVVLPYFIENRFARLAAQGAFFENVALFIAGQLEVMTLLVAVQTI
jgi:hypothetical protein